MNAEHTDSVNAKAGLRRDQRGAVLVEFVVVLVPRLTIFFVFTQLSAVAIAKLRFKHATVIGARAAAVFSNSGDNCPECSGSGQSEVNAAVRAALQGSGVTVLSASVQDSSNRDDPYNLVQVRVTGVYNCTVPLGRVICGGMLPFTETKSMPHQGARYRL